MGYCVFRCAQSWIELLFPTFAFATATGNQECRVSSRSQTEPNLSETTSRINSRIRWRHHDRRSIRIETRHRQNPLLFSTFGFATANPECRVTSQSQTSQTFRRQLHAFTHPPTPPRSPFNSHRNATSPKRYRGNRANSAQRERVLLSNTRASDVTAATAGISNSASYVLSVSCLFLCGPLRRISVNARFYVQCCLVLWRGGCYGGPLQFPDEIQGQSNWKSSHCWLDSPVVYPDLVLVAVCGRDQCCLSVRFTCLVMCMYCVMFELRRKSPKSPKRPKRRGSSVASQKNT